MYNCEIYSVLKNETDAQEFDKHLDDISDVLNKKNIRILYNTNIKPNSKTIAKALSSSEESSDAPNYNIFVNAIDTKDSKSFKELFYAFIKYNEDMIEPYEENEGKTAKIKIYSLGEIANGYKGYCFQIFDKYYVVLPQASLCGMDIVTLVDKAVDSAEAIFESIKDTNPDGLTFVDGKKSKKEGFFMSFIPHKGDTAGRVVRKIIVLLSMLVIIVGCVYLLFEFVINPYKNEQITSEIHSIAYSHIEQNPDDPNLPAQNWDALKKVNKEIVGWITIKGTKIDYPVLEHKGDDKHSQYYLSRTYKKDYSEYGSVFVDYRSKKSVNSKNVILHGHNMRDGSMFHSLLNYGDLKGNLDYYKKHPTIEFNTPAGDATYKIISVFKTSTLYDHGMFFNYMQGAFLSDAEFMNFVYNLRVRSLINCPVTVNEDDQLLTLSTCSYEFSNWRTVVVARKLREGEKPDVDLKFASLNSSPLFPEVYYRSRGGTRPKELTFKKADAKGLISWYDGKGNLEGDETLTATVAANPTEATDEDGKKVKPTAPTTYYQVKFLNYDGSEYHTVNVAEGKSVKIPKGTPGLPHDEYYNYTFTGWDTQGLNLNSVGCNMTIVPKFKATLKK